MNATTICIEFKGTDSLRREVFQNNDGTFTAMTFTRSKTFKTKAGAVRWLARAIAAIS
jgi:hypothetical protein